MAIVAAVFAGFVLTFLRRGLPLVFNGNEIADDALSSIFTPDDRSKPRKTINWKRTGTEAGQKRLALIRSLAKLRHEMPVFADGTQEWVTDGEAQGAVAFARRLDGCAVFVAANLTDKPVQFAPSGVALDPSRKPMLAERFTLDGQSVVLGPWGFVAVEY